MGRVAGGFGFVEGPVWKSGRLYFSDVRDNNIRALDRMGNVVVVLKASGGLTNPPKGSNSGSNGLITDKDGTILVTRMGIGTIERLDEKGGLKPLLSKYEGKRLPARPDIVVIDVSFISLKAVLPVALSLAAAPMHLLALIKPQFEAIGKHGKGGIIRDAAVHKQVCDEIAAFATNLGCADIKVFPSPIKGGDGNIEFFLGARRG